MNPHARPMNPQGANPHARPMNPHAMANPYARPHFNNQRAHPNARQGQGQHGRGGSYRPPPALLKAVAPAGPITKTPLGNIRRALKPGETDILAEKEKQAVELQTKRAAEKSASLPPSSTLFLSLVFVLSLLFQVGDGVAHLLKNLCFCLCAHLFSK